MEAEHVAKETAIKNKYDFIHTLDIPNPNPTEIVLNLRHPSVLLLGVDHCSGTPTLSFCTCSPSNVQGRKFCFVVDCVPICDVLHRDFGLVYPTRHEPTTTVTLTKPEAAPHLRRPRWIPGVTITLLFVQYNVPAKLRGHESTFMILFPVSCWTFVPNSM